MRKGCGPRLGGEGGRGGGGRKERESVKPASEPVSEAMRTQHAIARPGLRCSEQRVRQPESNILHYC